VATSHLRDYYLQTAWYIMNRVVINEPIEIRVYSCGRGAGCGGAIAGRGFGPDRTEYPIPLEIRNNDSTSSVLE
jgi:hypothetical protein